MLSSRVERPATSRGMRASRNVKVAGRRQAPGRDLLRSIELRRRVTTATPFGARDGHEGKEPRESIQWKARVDVRQEDATRTWALWRRFRMENALELNDVRMDRQPRTITGIWGDNFLLALASG